MKGTGINQQVTLALNGRGVVAYYEYPGFVSVPCDDGTVLATSDLNDTWTIDHQTADGGTTLDTYDTGIPDTSADVDRITDAIIEHKARTEHAL